MKDYNEQQVIPLYLYEWFCMEGIPYSGFVEELGYVLCEVIVTPTGNDCSTFGNTISYRKYYDFDNSKCDDKIDLSVKHHYIDYQKNIEMPSWDFFAGIAISESENRIYDIAKDKWLGKDFKYHSFYEYPSRIQTQKYGRPNNALKWQKILKNTGGVVNGYVIFNLLKQGYLDEVSNKTLLSELSSIGISELIKKCKGNVYSYAWSVGWELGRIITYTEWYQKRRFLFAYSLWENKYCSPNDANIDLWMYFFESYKETLK